MKIKISTLQVQKTVLAPSMQQSITVLMLPLLDLNQAIEQELQTNPLLEQEEDTAESPSEIPDHYLKRTMEQREKNSDLPSYNLTDEDESQEEKPISREVTLEESLLQQLRIEINDPLQLKIGELIIGNLNEDGYFHSNCAEIAQLAETEDLALVDQVLSIIQNFEPVGIASRDLKECLLIQLEYKYNGQGALPTRIILEHLEDLGRKKYPEISRKCGVSLEEVKSAVQMISSLEPKPARNFRTINPNIFIKPDVIIKKDPLHGFVVSVNQEGIMRLRVNPFYKNILSQNNLKEEEKVFIQEKMKNALNFIRSIEQRGQTIREIANYILEKQKDFFAGAHLSIVPLTLKDVATAISRNESTVSRAINNKYVETPQGIFPLKFFFSQSMASDSPHNGDPAAPTSSRSIQEEIKDMIDDEDKARPLSDREIEMHFKEKGVHLARRTVTKYRKNLKILPSHSRKDF